MNIPSKTKNFVVYNVRYQLGMNKSCQLVILDHDVFPMFKNRQILCIFD